MVHRFGNIFYLLNNWVFVQHCPFNAYIFSIQQCPHINTNDPINIILVLIKLTPYADIFQSKDKDSVNGIVGLLFKS